MRTKRVDLSKLTPEQKAALGQFVKDAKSVAPQMQEFQQLAQTIFQQFLKAPEWGIAESEPPKDVPRELWHVGAPEVNYVNHFERDQ